MRKPMSLHRFILYAGLLSLALTACSLPGRQAIEKPPAPASLPPPPETAQDTETPVLPEETGQEAKTEQEAETKEDQENHAAKSPKTPAPPDKASGAEKKKQRLRRHIEAGEFLTALDRLDLRDRHLNDATELAALYRRAVNEAIRQGQSRLAADKPGKAGLLFRAALSNYPRGPRLADEIALTHGQLESKIAVCAEKLMEQGLTVYRKGQLHQAIQVWQKILAFAPQHEASQNAIRTAHIQLNNLKKIKNDPPAAEIR